MKARIYCPAKTATQSGYAQSRTWCLEFDADSARSIDPLMGWTSSRDMTQQVRLDFPTREDAVAFAETHGLEYDVAPPQARRVRPKSYSDNFRHDRAR